MHTYTTEAQAIEAATRKTRAHALGDKTVFCVLEGPENDWVVCDLKTAIETEMPYRWFA